MKILQVTAAYYPAISIGGPIFSSLALARVLLNSHTLTTITTSLGMTKTEASRIRFDKYSESTLGHPLIYKKYIGPNNFTFSISYLRWLIGNISTFDLVILHGVWNFPFIAAAWICRRRSVPYIVIPHGTIYKETVELKSSFIKKVFLKLFVLDALNNAGVIAFSTEHEEESVKKFLKLTGHLTVIPNIVDSCAYATLPMPGFLRARFRLGDDVTILVHFGRITQKKGLEYSLKALRSLRSSGVNAVLCIVGGDAEKYSRRIGQQIAELGLESAIYFTGILDKEDGIRALVDSDIFVLPSLSENFGMAVVEAMLCQTPVVVSENVGIASVLQKEGAGLVVGLDDDARELAQSIDFLIKNPHERETLAERGRICAQRYFDTTAVQEQIESMIKLFEDKKLSTSFQE